MAEVQHHAPSWPAACHVRPRWLGATLLATAHLGGDGIQAQQRAQCCVHDETLLCAFKLTRSTSSASSPARQQRHDDCFTDLIAACASA